MFEQFVLDPLDPVSIAVRITDIERERIGDLNGCGPDGCSEIGHGASPIRSSSFRSARSSGLEDPVMVDR